MKKRTIQFHEEIKEKKKKIVFRMVIVICFVFFSSLFLYIIFFSSFFTIQSIVVTGTKFSNTAEIKADAAFLLRKNIFLAKIDTNRELKKFPLLRTLRLEKDYPSGITIIVDEYPPYALFQTNQKTYVSSLKGVVVDTVSNASTKYSLPLIVSDTNDLKNVALADILTYVAAIESEKNEFVTSLIFNYPYELTALYADGHRVHFSLNKSVNTQMQNADQIQKLIGFSKCQNVDVRFDNVYCSNV